jgi:hypothetical protein
LEPRPEIILFGRDEGVAELAEAIDARHVPDVAVNEKGTPLLSDLLRRGQELASHPAVCFVNADIILSPEISRVAGMVGHEPPRLVVGRRHDIELTDLVDPHDAGELAALVRSHEGGTLMPPVWIDYFVFRRGLFAELPDFAIGRPGYDNWMLWRAAAAGATLTDATGYVTALHQQHDYAFAGGKTAIWEGNEAKANASLISDWRRKYSIDYATERVAPDGSVVPATALRYRLARHKTRLGHALRFTRPLRRRLHGEHASRKPTVAGR